MISFSSPLSSMSSLGARAALRADPRVTATNRSQGGTAQEAGAAGGKQDPATTAQDARLSEQDQQRINSLKQRDREVRTHEGAHLAAAGGYARGGAQFEYQRGPDGQLYAVGGEVGIDTSAVSGNPAATLAKAETVQRAALAPAEPSGQDRRVASEAAAMAAQARQALAKEQKSGTAEAAAGQRLQGRIQSSGALDRPRQGGGLHLVA